MSFAPHTENFRSPPSLSRATGGEEAGVEEPLPLLLLPFVGTLSIFPLNTLAISSLLRILGTFGTTPTPQLSITGLGPN